MDTGGHGSKPCPIRENVSEISVTNCCKKLSRWIRKHINIFEQMDISGHRPRRSRTNKSRSRGRMRHWFPSCAAVSSRALIQRRMVFSGTRRSFAVLAMLRSGSGLVFCMVRLRSRGGDMRRSPVLGSLAGQKARKLLQGIH
jgi:hypothetical protein